MLFLLNGFMREITEGGIFKKVVTPRPVLSIGNVHFGGTGKTPHVIYTARHLFDHGKKVCVLTRGYKRKDTEYQIFGRGEDPISVDTIGDEPFLLKKKVPEVILCVGPNRFESMKRVLSEEDVDLFLLDDGFQQFKMDKSLDVVLLRYNDLPGLGKVLNHFTMRESPKSLKYADFLVITKTPVAVTGTSINLLHSRYFGDLESAYTRYKICGIMSNRGYSPENFGEKEVFLFGGVGDFSGFLDTVRDHGIDVGDSFSLPDHVAYSEKIMNKIRNLSKGRTLLTSEKDLVKLPHEKFGEIFSVSIDVEFVEGKESFDKKILDALGNG